MEVLEGNYCPKCGKECFATASDAKKALRNLKRRKRQDGACYFCKDCNSWHITHFSFRKSKAIRTVHEKGGYKDLVGEK